MLSPTQDPESCSTSVLIAFTLVLILTVMWLRSRSPQSRDSEFDPSDEFDSATRWESILPQPRWDGTPLPAGAQFPMWSTADVDPLVTGALYKHANHTRNVYGARTTHSDKHGLTEFSRSSGSVGYTVGPYGSADRWDDGLPSEWIIPSTQPSWYVSDHDDYYGPDGITTQNLGMYSLTEGDHDPLVG